MSFASVSRRVGGLVLVLAMAAGGSGHAQQPAPPVPAAAPAAAAASPAPVLGPAVVVLTVNMPQIMRDAKAAKGIQEQINAQTAAYSKEISRREAELQKMRADLDRQQTVLSPEAYNVKAKEFQQRYAELDQSFQANRQAVQQVYQDAVHKVEAAALQVVNEIAKERNANLVLAGQMIVFQTAAFDITPEAVTRLDKQLPAVEVTVPKLAEVATPVEPAPLPGPRKTPPKK
jgi:outer membrane protein